MGIKPARDNVCSLKGVEELLWPVQYNRGGNRARECVAEAAWHMAGADKDILMCSSQVLHRTHSDWDPPICHLSPKFT